MDSPAGQDDSLLIRLTKDRQGEWRSELPHAQPGWESSPQTIEGAVAEARTAAGESSGAPVRLQVTAEVVQQYVEELGRTLTAKFNLTTKDVLRLIEANGGPYGLDLSDCNLNGTDFSPDTIRAMRDAHREENERDPPWISHAPDAAYLYDVRLNRAQLSAANLTGAVLSFAQLNGATLHRADLRGAILVGTQLADAEFFRAELRGVDMYDVPSLEGVRWASAVIDHTRMRRDQLGRSIGDELTAHENPSPRAYHEASESYLLHKNNFLSLGRYEDAAWAYIKEQQMEKMAYRSEWRAHGWHLWKAWGSLWRWLRNWSYELLTGYGERTWMPVLWAIAVILAFATGYAVAGNISPDFAGDPATAQGSHDFLDALTHSIGAFATIGFNTLEPLGWGARLLTAIESALGVSLFALFIFTLGNRMSRS